MTTTHDISKITLDDLWSDVPAPEREFAATDIDGLPEPARRYLAHAIAPGTPLATAVRLSMSGQIKLGDWRRFEAEQVIRWDRGMIWRARVKMGPIPVTGSDRFIDGIGAMSWRALGLIPVMRADGPDITRSAAGRLQAEAIWLPSVLLGDDVRWSTDEDEHAVADIGVRGDEGRIRYQISQTGGLEELVMPRWGNPEGEAFHPCPFGAVIEAERTFRGFTIPSEVRVGWYFGTPRFAEDGEFFRATVHDAEFR